jgi:hypothetical protein
MRIFIVPWTVSRSSKAPGRLTLLGRYGKGTAAAAARMGLDMQRAPADEDNPPG